MAEDTSTPDPNDPIFQPQPELTDEEYLDAAWLEPRAFAPLYARYLTPVYRYCLLGLGKPEKAEAATTEAFVRVMRRLRMLRWRTLRSWLFEIVDEELRRASGDLLPDPELRVVILGWIGLSTREIAEALGLTVATVEEAQSDAIRERLTLPTEREWDLGIEALPRPEPAFAARLWSLIAGIQPTQIGSAAPLSPRAARRLMEDQSAKPRDLRVLIVEPEAIFRRGLSTLIGASPAMGVVDGVAAADAGFDRLNDGQVDVAVVGTTLSVVSWIAYVSEIRRRHPDVAVVVVSANERDEELTAAIRAGATAYCGRAVPEARLLELIERAAIGQYVINDHILERPHLAREILDVFSTGDESSSDPVRTLVPLAKYDRVVLGWIGVGRSLASFAERAGSTEEKAATYVLSVLRGRGYHDGLQSVFSAKRRGRPLFNGDEPPQAPRLLASARHPPLPLRQLKLSASVERATTRAEWALPDLPVAGALLRCVLDEPGGVAIRLHRDAGIELPYDLLGSIAPEPPAVSQRSEFVIDRNREIARWLWSLRTPLSPRSESEVSTAHLLKLLLEDASTAELDAGWLSDLDRGHLIRMAEVAIAAEERDDPDADAQRVEATRRGPGPWTISRALREPEPEPDRAGDDEDMPWQQFRGRP